MSTLEPVYTAKPRILLVEDELIAQTVNCMMLKESGYHVDIASNGAEALEKASADYTLILMDVGLPDLDGIKVTKIIRCYERNQKRIPIIMLTAYVEEKIRDACLTAGADGVYAKPMIKEKLVEIINQFIG
jgi:CheY-like chemotaxis protein